MAYGMDVPVFESRLRKGLTLKIWRPNMKPCKPRVQRTLGVCERGNPAGVQVDLSPIGRATSKTVFEGAFTRHYAFILSTTGSLIFILGKKS